MSFKNFSTKQDAPSEGKPDGKAKAASTADKPMTGPDAAPATVAPEKSS
jgi:hypothetical protein